MGLLLELPLSFPNDPILNGIIGVAPDKLTKGERHTFDINLYKYVAFLPITDPLSESNVGSSPKKLP